MAPDWEVFMRQLEQWVREMERFMAHVDQARSAPFSRMALAPMASVRWHPAVNVYETADTVVVQAELAGVDPDDVTVQYEAPRLLVQGQRREAISTEAQSIHRLEIPAGRFAFEVRLPGAVDAEEATATLRAGMLEVRLPKRPLHHSGVIPLSPVEGERRST